MGVEGLALAIEASNPSADGPGGPGVALGVLRAGGVELLGVERLRAGARHDDDLMPAIGRLWERVGARRAALRIVAASIGPGGYTGVRLAVTTARMIGAALAARCVGVSTPEALARRVPVEIPTPFGVALASKGATAHVTSFVSRCGVGARARVCDEWGLAGVRALVADAHLPEGMRAWCARAGVPVIAPWYDASAVLECAAGGEGLAPADLAPVYPREAEAVRKWRELHGGEPPRIGG